MFKQFIDPYKKNKETYDRLIPAGYNVRFNVNMLNNFFRKQKDNFLFSNISGNNIDVQQLAVHLMRSGIVNPENIKLETLANYFGIEINAHEAMSDIKATRLVYLELLKSFDKEVKLLNKREVL